MTDTTTREVTREELREMINNLPDDVVISIEVKVVLQDG